MPIWQLPLGKPPDITYTGVGSHGHEKTSRRYCLDGVWSVHLHRYDGWLELDDARYPLHDGAVTLVPPGTPFRHIWRHPGSVHFFSLFRVSKKATTTSLPLLQDLGEDTPLCFDELGEAAGRFFSEPARAVAAVWQFLWRLKDKAEARQVAVGTEEERRLAACLKLIEERIGERSALGDIATEVGLTRNQMIRLFKRRLGISPLDHLMARRWERAHALLTSTPLPPKHIAIDLGFGDLSHFNKFVRQRGGKSPRRLREEGL